MTSLEQYSGSQPQDGSTGTAKLGDAELRVYVLRAVTQVEQSLNPLMDVMLNELQARIERSRSNAERQLLSDAFVALHKRKPAVLAQFSRKLRELVENELLPSGTQAKPTLDAVTLQGLSLVDDEQMSEEIIAKRTAMKIETAAEWELREVTSFFSALQGLTEPDQERNPLRPDLLSRALHRALEGAADEGDTRRLLESSIGDSLAVAMKATYTRIAEDLKRRNVKPLDFAAKSSIGTGNISGLDSGAAPGRPLEQALLEELAHEAQAEATLSLAQSLQSAMSNVFGIAPHFAQGETGASGRSAGVYHPGAYPTVDSGYDSVRGPNSASSRYGRYSRSGPPSMSGPPSVSGSHSQSGPYSRRGVDSGGGWSSSQGPHSTGSRNSRLYELLMDLRGSVWGSPTDVRSVSVKNARGFGDSGFADSTRSARSFASTEPYRTSGFGPANEGAALNPVRAHLAQLQAATQEPYRTTIEIVALMFDAILQDKMLQPLAARLITRLQLPLLDVALNDANLFARPDHPLHALVNRLGSAAAAFDVYESGPGQRFYAAALSIVEEILESDFFALETYRSALDKLNNFIKHEGLADNPFHADVARILAMKEMGLHLEHSLSKQVTPLIEGMPIQPFLRDFFLRTWVQAQVAAVLRYGEKSPESHRYSRMCSDLVWSVQAKNTPEEKRQLVAALPHLMRDVNEAFTLLKWPPLEQKDFRAKLIEHQARAMKGVADEHAAYNLDLLSEQGSRVINALKILSVPTFDELQASALTQTEINADACVFSDTERGATGFMRNDEVSVIADMDVPLFDESQSKALQGAVQTSLAFEQKALEEAQKADDFPSIEEEISHEKIRAMHAGDVYEIKITGKWSKLRLTWLSDMHSFYLFADCADTKLKRTLTSHTLSRLWAEGDIRRFEAQLLMERAIESTRKALLEGSRGSSGIA